MAMARYHLFFNCHTAVMAGFTFLPITVLLIGTVTAQNPSAVDLVNDIYTGCVKDWSLSCARPKALQWFSEVSQNDEIKITHDLVIVKKDNPKEFEQGRGLEDDVFERFEDFIQSHDLIVKPPVVLAQTGAFKKLFARSLEPQEVKVPLAVTGRSSKIVKKVILPFLLGLKFKTAILVPLVLALIALKTWKALTLGLLSLVLTGALLIFKLTKPKTVNYEVIHYPQHVDHHVVDHAPISSGWDHPGYGRQLNPDEMAYNAYLN